MRNDYHGVAAADHGADVRSGASALGRLRLLPQERLARGDHRRLPVAPLQVVGRVGRRRGRRRGNRQGQAQRRRHGPEQDVRALGGAAVRPLGVWHFLPFFLRGG